MQSPDKPTRMSVFLRGGPKDGESLDVPYVTDTLYFDSIEMLAIEPMVSRHQPMQDMGLLLAGENAGMQHVRHEYKQTHDSGSFLIFTWRGCVAK